MLLLVFHQRRISCLLAVLSSAHLLLAERNWILNLIVPQCDVVSQNPPEHSAAWVSVAWVIVSLARALMASVIPKRHLMWIKCLGESGLSKENLHVISSNCADNYYIRWLDKYVCSANIAAKNLKDSCRLFFFKTVAWPQPGCCSPSQSAVRSLGTVLHVLA